MWLNIFSTPGVLSCQLESDGWLLSLEWQSVAFPEESSGDPCIPEHGWLDPERVKTLSPCSPSSGKDHGVSCAPLAGWVSGWKAAALGALPQVPTPNWPHRTYKEFTHLLVSLPGDLNCPFKTSALALNLSQTMHCLAKSHICPCWVQSTQDQKSSHNHQLPVPRFMKLYHPYMKSGVVCNPCHHAWEVSTSSRHRSLALVHSSGTLEDPIHWQHHAATAVGPVSADTSWACLI